MAGWEQFGLSLNNYGGWEEFESPMGTAMGVGRSLNLLWEHLWGDGSNLDYH